MIKIKDLKPPFFLIIVIWAVFLVDLLLPVRLVQFGIRPRTMSGLLGILFAPFLHAGIGHIISNTAALFFLTFFLILFYRKIALQIWGLSAVLGGTMVWVFAGVFSYNNVVHVGASGVVFSLIAFLISSGIFQKTIKSLLLGFVVFFFYGGALIGVLPSRPGVSWEGHLFGAIAGVFLAYFFSKKTKNGQKPE